MHINRISKPRYLLKGLTVLGLAYWSSFAIADSQQSQDTSTPVLDACYLEGLSDRLECGSVLVAENPEKPEGKQIEIHFAILPAIKNTYPDEALLAIAGGPGQSAMDNAAGFDRMLSKVRQQRDILLIDQRGTGLSNQLSCDSEMQESPLSIDESEIDSERETLACLEKQEADTTQYASLNALNDFEAVREYLGYKKLHLYGISYGSRMAQLYMRHFGEHLATVTLDGIVPMQQNVLAIGHAIDRAFDKLLGNCQSNVLCQQEFPELNKDLAKVLAQLEQGSVISQAQDPLTGEPTQLTMTKGKFMGAIRMALYDPSVRALIPHAIHQASKGNFQSVMGLFALTTDNAGIAMGMHTSVVCSEDWPRLTPEFRADATTSYFGKEMVEGYDKTCPIWQMPSVDKTFSNAIESNIPTLLLSGELDPATPPSWGALATEKLTNAKHFIAPYATHGVAYQSCGNKLVAQLVESSSVDGLDETCLSKDVSRNFYLNASTVEAIPALESEEGQSQIAEKANQSKQPLGNSNQLVTDADKE